MRVANPQQSSHKDGMNEQLEQSLRKIRDAAQRLEGVIRQVSLIHSATFGKLADAEVWIKPDSSGGTSIQTIAANSVGESESESVRARARAREG